MSPRRQYLKTLRWQRKRCSTLADLLHYEMSRCRRLSLYKTESRRWGSVTFPSVVVKLENGSEVEVVEDKGSAFRGIQWPSNGRVINEPVDFK